MSQLQAVILAAGKGTRMKSDLPKVLHEINGRPMVQYVVDAVRQAGVQDICLVIGHGAEEVKKSMGEQAVYAIQDKQLGTGHAVRCATAFIGEAGDTFVLCGDTPLVTGDTLKKLYEKHRSEGNAVTAISAELENPKGYGRIIRNEQGEFLKSVEDKDCSEEERKVTEVNAGMYLFRSKELKQALELLNNDNAQGEYYLPDTLEILKKQGYGINAMVLDRAEEMLGVNTQEQLKEAAALLKK